MRTIDTIIERWENVLRVLTSMTRHEREHHFAMTIWGTKTSCGTVGCAAGHCSLDPWFRKRGFKGEWATNPYSTLPDRESELTLNGNFDFTPGIEDFFIGDVNIFDLPEGSKREKLYAIAEDLTGIFFCAQGTTFGEVTRAVRKGIRQLKELKDARSTSA